MVISGAVDPVFMAFLIPKILQNILESIWEHLGNLLFLLYGTSKNPKFGPTKHLFVFDIFLDPPTPKRLVYIIVFEGHWPWYVLENLGRPLVLTKCKIISKSEWIKHIFQRVTSHLSKKVSPRTLLVFMDHSNFWFFSPRTFLVFMENHGFEL